MANMICPLAAAKQDAMAITQRESNLRSLRCQPAACRLWRTKDRAGSLCLNSQRFQFCAASSGSVKLFIQPRSRGRVRCTVAVGRDNHLGWVCCP